MPAVFQILLHIRGERIENQRAARREAEHRHERDAVLPQAAQRARFLALTRRGGGGFIERFTQIERDQRRDRADHERHAPAPGFEFRGRERLLQDHQHEERAQLAADQRHVLERREEAAPPFQRDLAHIRCTGAVFAAHGESLEQPRDEQQRRRERADLRVRGQHGDHQRAAAHHEDRDHHRGTPAVLVGETAKEPAADRPHQKACREHAGRVQQLRGGVAAWEERGREVQRAERVDVKVEPLDEIAR